MTTVELFQQAISILSNGEWENEKTHEEADEKLNEIIIRIYTECDSDEVHDLLDELDSGPALTIVTDKLELINATAIVAEIEAASIEIGADELKAAIDSGEATEMNAEQVRAMLGKVTH